MTPAARPVFQTDLDLPGLRRGKVRDVYDLPPGIHAPGSAAAAGLLIVASDRISAFDVVMPTPIPGKGRLLTGIATFWLRWIESRGLCRTHLVSTDAGLIPQAALGRTARADLEGRVMLARRCRVIPIECVARGYLEGSGWKEYQQTGSVCGIKLPAGLKQCDRLPEPIFTPATKEEQGKHDENVSFERASALVGGALMDKLRTLTLNIYRAAADHARERGIIIADTKFEFGLPDEQGADAREPILIDEALTPDSSRFWPAVDYAPGRAQKSYDKQFLREYLETLVAQGTWNKQAPGPELPAEIIEGTRARYQAAFDQLTR
ncbi:MAG: phosphoribosylaminoimidazolesuccinocarboxamide synthase [Planctomycetota bacterium]|nr:phosphoribosylaminoimidazolesuccinocarboxamide synthase [Planctomycetota bacterium]